MRPKSLPTIRRRHHRVHRHHWGCSCQIVRGNCSQLFLSLRSPAACLRSPRTVRHAQTIPAFRTASDNAARKPLVLSCRARNEASLLVSRRRTRQDHARVAAKPSSPAPPTPGKPTQTSAAPPLQPAVANAHAEFDDAARNQANANPSPSDTASSTMRNQASADPLPSDTAPAETTQTADTAPEAVTTRWPDPAINTASAISVAQQPASATTVSPARNCGTTDRRLRQ